MDGWSNGEGQEARNKNAKDAKMLNLFLCFALFALFAFFANHKNICVYLRLSVDLINLCALYAFAVNI
jgi:hypothetical protein